MSYTKYNREEVLKKSIKYFKNDELAANVWVNKYALKDSDGNIYESSPEDMHNRIADELYRIECKYPNPISREEIFETLDKFKYIVPQGSPMSGIGNNFQIVSLSNCFVIGNEADSYSGIFLTDEEQAQLMKRRGGVGHDLSHIRPRGSKVNNSALSSTGVVSFMERFSNTTREVAQDGRRGALMLSISIKHPDAEDFIDAKLTKGKVTGANISVRITDDFMKAVLNNEKFVQQYPVDSDSPIYTKEIDAKKLWDKIIHNAWKSAEPGILFWDNIISESIPDCYADLGYKTVSTNPCGEIPLCTSDSCRLLAINLYSYVVNPFTKDAYFDFDLFKKHVIIAQRYMDDIVDLEIEKIDTILEKIDTDPEDEFVKFKEKNLWEKIKDKTIRGRRTGLGITAEGDMLAALNITYGTKEAIEFSSKVHKFLSQNAYLSSTIMAEERGSFPIYDFEREINNPFIKRITEDFPELIERMKIYGRRNIALLTAAPTGTVSLMTKTTSGIEPVFLPVYKRRKKVNPNDKNVNVSFVDEVGDSWEEYTVFHHKFETWLIVNNYNIDEIKKMSNDELQEVVKLSPYYKATSNDVDWVEKVKLQGEIQKWIDHSISVTVNLPKDITEEMVSKVYETGWSSKCKGITVYRDGSRSGVLISNDENKEEKKDKNTTVNDDKTVNDIIRENNAIKRPKNLECDIIRFTNKGEKWISFVGLMKDENGLDRPYEIFTGIQESFPIPQNIEKGIIKKVKDKIEDDVEYDENGQEIYIKRYDFTYQDKDGYKVTIEGLSRAFNREYWNYAKLVSGLLRHGMPIPNLINLIDGLDLEGGDLIGTWKAGVKRILKKYVKDNTKSKNICPKCHQDTVVFQDGCLICTNCGESKC